MHLNQSLIKIENISENDLKADLDRFKDPDTRKDAVIFISK